MRAARYEVVECYTSPYPDSILFEQGEAISLGKEYTEDPAWAGWIWGKSTNNKMAWVPRQFLDIRGKTGVFNTRYDAKELGIGLGETITVYEIVNGFGMAINSNGELGWVPLRNLKFIDYADNSISPIGPTD